MEDYMFYIDIINIMSLLFFSCLFFMGLVIVCIKCGRWGKDVKKWIGRSNKIVCKCKWI